MGSIHWFLVVRIIRCSPTRLSERSNAKSCLSIRRKIARVPWKKRSIDNHFAQRRQPAVSYAWLSPTEPIIFSTSLATRCSCTSARLNCNLCPRFWQTPCHEIVGAGRSCLEERHQGCRSHLNTQLGWAPKSVPTVRCSAGGSSELTKFRNRSEKTSG